MTGSPAIFLPRISGSDMFWSANAWLPISSDSVTASRFGLGSSMPITLRPGMVATRADSADMLRAMSSASWITRLALMPLAGSSSYIVTTGPGRTSTMSPRTWKSSSTLSSSRALRSRPARSICALALLRRRRRAGRAPAAGNCRRAPGSAGAAARRLLRTGLAAARSAWPARRRRRPAATSAARRWPVLVIVRSSRAARRGDPGPGLAAENVGGSLLGRLQARAQIAENEAGEGEDHQHDEPHRPGDRSIADEPDRRVDAIGARQGRAPRPSRPAGPDTADALVRLKRNADQAAPIAATSNARPTRPVGSSRIIRRPARAMTGRNSTEPMPNRSSSTSLA